MKKFEKHCASGLSTGAMPRCGDIVQMASPPLKNGYAPVINNNFKNIDKKKKNSNLYFVIISRPPLWEPLNTINCTALP